MKDSEIIEKYNKAKKFAERCFIYDFDKEDFPSWVIIKAMSTKTRGETGFRFLAIDYLRERYGRKGSKCIKLKRALKYAGDIRNLDYGRGQGQLDNGSIEMDNSESGDSSTGIGKHISHDIQNSGSTRVRRQGVMYKMCIEKGMTEKDVAKFFGVTESRVSQIIRPLKILKVAELACDRYRGLAPLEISWL